MSRKKSINKISNLSLIREVVRLILNEAFENPPATEKEAAALLRILNYDIQAGTSGVASKQQQVQAQEAQEIKDLIDTNKNNIFDKDEIENIINTWNDISFKLKSLYGPRMMKARSASQAVSKKKK